jgi:hypothetical protein
LILSYGCNRSQGQARNGSKLQGRCGSAWPMLGTLFGRCLPHLRLRASRPPKSQSFERWGTR